MTSRPPILRGIPILRILAVAVLASSCVSVQEPAQEPNAIPESIPVRIPDGFEVSAELLRAEYADVPSVAGHPYQILDRQVTLKYADDGSLERTTRMVLRILTSVGVERHSILNASWQPWRQAKPELRARVISPSGAVAVLDPSTIVEVGADSGSASLRTDARVVSAPIPRLEVGALLEYILIEKSVEARPGAGIGGSVKIGDSVPVRRVTIRISSPADLQVKYKVRGKVDADVQAGVSGTTREVKLVFLSLPAYGAQETLLPYDEAPVPFLRFGSAASWQTTAQVYREATEAILVSEPISSWAKSALGEIDATHDPLKAAIALADATRSAVRYTGVNFGENSIIPHKPSETIALGYGDCKDQASLLVASLRSVGIKADLALLLSGFSTDVEPSVPGLDAFDHAIVRVPTLGLWMDPTATYTPAEKIPLSDQDRLALVISSDTRELERIPVESKPWQRDYQEVRLSSSGRATSVIETTTAGGSAEYGMREHWSRVPLDQALKRLREYGDKAHETKGSEAKLGVPSELSKDFFVQVIVKDSKLGWTESTRAYYVMRAGTLFDPLPSALKPDQAEKSPKRLSDLRVVGVPVSELVFDVKAPPGHALSYVPESQTVDLGPARIISTFESPDAESLTARFRLEFVKDRITPAEYETYLANVDKFLKSRAVVASFENVGRALADSGRLKEAMSAFRTLEARYPEDPVYSMQAAETLLKAGFPEDAVIEAERAVRLAPKNPQAHRLLAVMSLYDPFGAQFREGGNLPRAADEFLAAYRLNPENKGNLFDHATVLEYGADFVRRGKGARLDDALAAYRTELGSIEAEGRVDSYLGLLFHMGRYGDIVEFARSLKEQKGGGHYLVAAVAAQDGTPAALNHAAALWSNADDRRSILSKASLALMSARRFVPASELLLASARGTSNFAATSELCRVVAKVLPAEPIPESTARASPRGMVSSLLRAIILEGRVPMELMSKRLSDSSGDNLDREFGKSIEGMRATLRSLSLSDEALTDFILAIIEVKSGKAGPLTFVSVGMPAIGKDQVGDFVLIDEPDGLAFFDSHGANGAGKVVWELIQSGRADEASMVLKALVSPATVLPSFSLSLNRATELCVRAESSDAIDAAVSCAALGGWESDASLAATFIGPCLSMLDNEPQGERRVSLISLALRLALKAGDAGSLEKAVRAAESFDGSAAEYRRLASDLRAGKRLDLAERVVQAGLRKHPNAADLLRTMAVTAGDTGRIDEYYRLYGEVIAAGAGDSSAYNNQAWGALFLGSAELESVQGPGFIRRLEEGGAYSLHTLVCVLGAAGKFEEARSSYQKLTGTRDETDDPAMWLAHGYLALSFGLKERAAQSFAKAAIVTDNLLDSAALAKRMLETMGKNSE